MVWSTVIYYDRNAHERIFISLSSEGKFSSESFEIKKQIQNLIGSKRKILIQNVENRKVSHNF